MTKKYDDIINLPHYEPKNHPRMAPEKRAAQFAPFAALTGYGDAVEEAARYTEREMTLSQDELEELDRKMSLLLARAQQDAAQQDPGAEPDRNLEIRILYFKPDEKKAGGSFLEARGRIKKIEYQRRHFLMEDGTKIPFDHIIDLDGDL